MGTEHLSRRMLIAMTVATAMIGCGKSDDGGPSTGGTTSSAGGSGGATSAGGTTSSGGTVSGGTTGTSSATASGGAPGTGGASAGSGGRTVGSGGAVNTGGAVHAGGAIATGGLAQAGGVVATGGSQAGGETGPVGGLAAGGRTGLGGRASGGVAGGGMTAAGGATGTAGMTGAAGTTGGKGGSTGTGTCTASKDAGKTVSGSGPHKVVVETNSDSGAACGTIYRPADLGGAEKYPIFVWGEGGCSRNGLSNQASMAEIASHGYFVVADGPAGSAGNCGSISMSNDVAGMAKVMIGYIDWAIAENGKSCSAYYQSIDTTKISADGFSCGGLMAMGTAGDARMTTFGFTSSGLTSAVASYYKTIHTPVKILLGGSGDVAYPNGERDYDNISALGIPVLLLSKEGAGHGGDLSNGKGDFNSINLAWLNWQLKADEGATGKGALVGASCKWCNNSAWEFKSKNLP